ncbi:MAG: sulfatase [Chloroflexi bacterium]|nr:sulfatase [Chloroflexota bacterium]
MPTQINVLFVVLDTTRHDRLSLYGHPRDTTPELDAFAGQAAVFDRALSPAQWTIPAHASMFTGVYPSTHTLTEADRTLPVQFPTTAQILRDAGYQTAGFCNNPLLGVLNHGLTRGFDDFYNYAGAAINRPFERAFGPPVDSAVRSWRQFARTVGNQFAQREWLFRVSLNPMFTPVWTRLINYKGSSANSISDLIGYMQKHRAGGQSKPLFAFLNLMGTHLPYRPPRDVLEHIAPGLDQASYQFMAHFNADAARWASPVEAPLEDWQSHALEAFYDAEIRAQDAQLGRLFAYLKTSGALKDTLVIISADHGEGHGDHGFFGHSFVVNHELTHVPLIVHSPEGFRRGERIDTPVSTRRIFHTILDAAGIESAADQGAGTAGMTLTQAGMPGELAFSEAFPPQTFLGVLRYRAPAFIDALRLTQVRRAVLRGSLKLTTLGEVPEALYDVENDPAEAQDIQQQHPAATAEMLALIAGFVRDAEQQRAGVSVLAERAALSPEMMENLRALGYIE